MPSGCEVEGDVGDGVCGYGKLERRELVVGALSECLVAVCEGQQVSVAGEPERVAVQVAGRTGRVGTVDLRPGTDRQDASEPHAFMPDALADMFGAAGQFAQPGHRSVCERCPGVGDVHDAVRTLISLDDNRDLPVVSFHRVGVVRVLK